jgi:hypothetical protein
MDPEVQISLDHTVSSYAFGLWIENGEMSSAIARPSPFIMPGIKGKFLAITNRCDTGSTHPQSRHILPDGVGAAFP